MQINFGDMAEEIKLSKTDDQPWGFRVTGGLDFGTPVTVIKVQSFFSTIPFFEKLLDHLEQGFSNCGTCTTSCMPATVQWYTGLALKNRTKK
jgi:hypothetical protein